MAYVVVIGQKFVVEVSLCPDNKGATTAMTEVPFDLPAVRRKNVTAEFDCEPISSDGGVMTSDAGVLLLGATNRAVTTSSGEDIQPETLSGMVEDEYYLRRACGV